MHPTLAMHEVTAADKSTPSVGAPVAPMCEWCGFVPAESCHLPGEFLGRATAAPGRCEGLRHVPPEAALPLLAVVTSFK